MFIKILAICGVWISGAVAMDRPEMPELDREDNYGAQTPVRPQDNPLVRRPGESKQAHLRRVLFDGAPEEKAPSPKRPKFKQWQRYDGMAGQPKIRKGPK